MLHNTKKIYTSIWKLLIRYPHRFLQLSIYKKISLIFQVLFMMEIS